MSCPCGSQKGFDRCCGPYLSGQVDPPTAEALMRSRYVAYTRGDIDYIARTTAPESRGDFDARAARAWSAQATWLGLQVLASDGGRADDRDGEVEFIATYRQNGDTIVHHERSRFRKTEAGEWRFVDGRPLRSPSSEIPLTQAKVGRNDPCPCGSGKKFKKCCGAAEGATGSA